MPLSTLSAGTGRETGQLVGKGRAQTGGLATFREQYRYSSPTFDVTTSDGTRPEGGISRRPEQSPQCPEIAAGAKVLDRRQAGSQRTFRPASDRRSTLATWVRTRAGERSPRRPRQRRVRPWRGSRPRAFARFRAKHPPPGWHPDPWLAGHHRFWDGRAWQASPTGTEPVIDVVAQDRRHETKRGQAAVTRSWTSAPGSLLPRGPSVGLAGGRVGCRPFSEPAGLCLTA